ncbi:hypothetical protein psyc5s11_50840 [Clostridium gelidum]|uniref:GtrA/DPMS transmembrane domain-containing protein n=1 Tax=Clostridium gelidum TaxID=704125 RepID=A0ABN6J453_9CLOT|nr:GtrA family protein [Clostridium gelidum]BCZ49017.1 hypothetical protein psyc5s11_50840 [Clostridium gelidum]
MIKSMNNSFSRFLLVGGTSTILDYVIYIILSRYIDYSLAKVISMCCACTYSFFLNKEFSFKDQSKNNIDQLIKYVVAQVINITVNVLVNAFVLKTVGIKIIAFIVATGTAMIVNYLLQKVFVFRGVKK